MKYLLNIEFNINFLFKNFFSINAYLKYIKYGMIVYY